MMSAVSGPAESNGRQDGAENGAGVLANLPRTRPQRASARRTAARRTGAATQQVPPPAKAGGAKRAAKTVKSAASNGATAAPKPKPKPKAKRAATSPGTAKRSAPPAARARRPAADPPRAAAAKAPRARRVPKPPLAEPVPRQGFESEEERATGAVQPPGGTEFVNTAAEILGELTKAGISSGERLLRDVISRLGR
jgi:hypothetical protein